MRSWDESGRYLAYCPGGVRHEAGVSTIISRATGYRYLDEVIEALVAQAPDLHQALQRAKTTA
jgi:ABC-type enterochelin transport system ATPase subunit